MALDTEAEAVERPSTWAALAVPEYRALFLAGLLVFVGVQAQQIARGALAYDLTGSNAGLGGVYLGFAIPMLVLTPIGGVAADRLPKRTVMLGAQVCLVTSAIWIGLAEVMDVLEYWMLVGASALQATGFSVFGPTRVAFTGEVVPKPLLGNAVALSQVSLNSTRVLAPALAGVLIGIKTIGAGGTYLITAGVMVLAFFMTLRLPHRPPRADRAPRSILNEFADGVRYARSVPTLRMLIVTSFVMVMIGWPYLAFLPSVSEELFDAGDTGYAVMSAVGAAAALGTTLWIAGRARPDQALRIQTVSGVILAIGLLGIAASPTFAVCLGALLLVGGAASGYQAMNNTIVLTVADLEYHGRVQSLLMLSFSGFGFAALPLGVLADHLGLRALFTGMGVICLVTMCVYIWRQQRLKAHGELVLDSAPA